MPESQHAHRKDEHLALAEANFRQKAPISSLEAVRLIHRPFPETAVDQVNLQVNDATLPFNYPFYIEAMTGGSQRTGEINAQLARVARQTGLAMAVGSQSIALKEPAVADTFKVVRAENPDGIILANIGAGNTVVQAQAAIEMIQADALEYHVNVAQELVMPEGDRDFYWLDDLAEIIANVDVPVIVKEVGFGMDAATLTQLADMGVAYVNLGGRSGTNFAEIEDRRDRQNPRSHAYMYDWGQTTAESLLEAQIAERTPRIIAAGGIQNPLDVLKAQVLGAQAVGVAGHFLHTLLQSGEAGLLAEVQQWQAHLAKLYTLVGAQTAADLRDVPYVLNTDLLAYQTQRQAQQ